MTPFCCGEYGAVKVSLDPQLGEVVVEGRRSELATPVCAQRSEFSSGLELCCRLDTLDGSWRLILHFQQNKPHEVTCVIH